MQRVLTAVEMREVDRLTIDERGIPGLVLMENAASAVTSLLIQKYSPIAERRVAILCGKGNNGGDGLAIARQLLVRRRPATLRVFLFAEPGSLSADAAVNLRMLRGIDFEPEIVIDRDAWASVRGRVLSADIIVDGLLGSGLSGPARGVAAEVIADVNAANPKPAVVAIDLPSGMGSDSGQKLGESMRAEHTVTFTAPKVSQVVPPSCERIGELTVAAIGTAPSVVDSLPGPRLLQTEPSDVGPYVAARDRSGHKGTYGHVLAVGGSRSKPGAVRMTGEAALRMGAGLVTVVTSESAANAIVSAAPELMVEPAREMADGSMGSESWRPEWLERKSVVAIGPGLGSSSANAEFLKRVYRQCPLPLVVDADGLTALGGDPLPRREAATVLTPHPGEMSRLTGRSSEEIQSDRVAIARDYAVANRVILVLKGNRTLIACPAGDVIVNPTGSPGMATAGSGDVLTGIIAALIAQFPAETVECTVVAAVYLHGAAGELAADEIGEQSMLATDIVEFLPAAIRSIKD